MRLVSLPPYSPQLNPIENIWEEIREKWFSNKVFRDFDSVIDTLAEALLSLGNYTKRVHKIAGFKWIIIDLRISNEENFHRPSSPLFYNPSQSPLL